MSRKVQIVAWCEDTQHDSFVRRLLKDQGWTHRNNRIERSPSGRGAGAQWVLDQVPREIEAFRSRNKKVNCALIFVIDGDRYGAKDRLRAFDRKCHAAGVSTRTPNERIAIFVPTWEIETWMAYLDGESVDESRKDYPKYQGRESECQRHVEALSRMCRAGQLRAPAPDSLEAACGEYQRFAGLEARS